MRTVRRIWSAITMAFVIAFIAFGAFVLFEAGAFTTQPATGIDFGEPVPGQRVYDTAGIWSEATEARAEQIAQTIEARSGAQLAIYSEDIEYGLSIEQARARAAALGNQWGVGQAGFDDGFVVYFGIEPDGIRGHVALVGGDGFRATYITDRDSDQIFEEAILPWLAGGRAQYDRALIAGLERVDTYVTPERAAELRLARQVNAVLGLIVAPGLFILLAAWVILTWRREGRDPVYLDSPSIHLPAPPADLTAASGAAVWEGKVSRRALTAALLDLASRGLIGFVERKKFLGQKVNLLSGGIAAKDPVEEAYRGLNSRRPIAEAERYALSEIRKIGLTVTGSGEAFPGELDETELATLGTKTSEFNEHLEHHIVAKGWLREPPSAASGRWYLRGGAMLVGGAIAFFVGLEIPMSGLTVVGVALAVAGVVSFIVAPHMPAVTKQGAMIRAMLAAYRRTLEKTMAQARSMQEVVDEAKLDWLQTPDQATVWGVALGLGSAVEKVLERSKADIEAGRVDRVNTWLPGWYATTGGGGSGGGPGGSMFSGSGLPNFGSMMASLGTIGTPPSSSGSSGGGGGSFGGGGGFSGGGGGRF